MKKFYRSAALLILACAITSLSSCGGGQGSSNENNPDSDNPKVSLHATAITATDTSVTITISKTGTVDHFTMSCDPLKGKTLPIPRPSLPGTTETFTENSLTPEMRYIVRITAFNDSNQSIGNNVFCVETASSGNTLSFNLIYDLDGLQKINNNQSGHYLISNDMDFSEYKNTWTPIGSTSSGFSGILNGNGYVVTSLKVLNYTYDSTNIGLFGCIDNGTVFSLGLTDIEIYGYKNVGSLAGQNISGAIYNCYASGKVLSMKSNTGGLVGFNNQGTISDCYASVSVDGGNSAAPNDSNYHGGLVGNNEEGIIVNCYATGTIGHTSNPDNDFGITNGGLVGYNNQGKISKCHATGNVGYKSIKRGGLVGENSGIISECYATGSVSGSQYVGGLVGLSDLGEITKCFATGKVTGGTNYTGGLVAYNGWSDTSKIINCYATGSVSGGGQVGGLVGYNDYGTIATSYAAGSVSGSNDLGGLLGFAYSEISLPDSYFIKGTADNDFGIAITNANMKKKETFTSWDFHTTWSLKNSVNNGYPYLTGVTPEK
ncbi:MAG TPA: GLUG motif-containing protein [Spirochaetota bacterium]|nr:GLUG motif-containing protein [Spirochaetota bacterium]HQQ24374.1 GLUG motif-containing protein [Spirochaetota bacterium]